MPAPLTTVHRPAREVDLRLTLAPLAQGRTDPTVQREGSAFWLTLSTAGGDATLHLARRADGIHASAWGPGAEHAIARVPALCGAADDDTGFEAARHPLVAELRRRMPGLRLARTGRILAFLVPSILGQKVTGIEQRRAWRELVTRYGTPAPGPAPIGMRVAPPPAAWQRVPSWEWHRAGVGPQRSDTVMRAVAVGDALERAATASAPDAIRRLRTVPGVGVWTAHEVVQRSHGDPDTISVGDFHLAKQVGWALAGRRVDDDGMLELLQPWAGHRQRVVRLIEAAGIGYERHGPRLAIPEHRAR